MVKVAEYTGNSISARERFRLRIRDAVRHFELSTAAQLILHTRAVTLILVLAELELAFDFRDLHLDTDDGFDHLADEFGFRIGNFPWTGIAGACLVAPCQPPHNTAHILLIVPDAKDSVPMNHAVVPRRHLAMEFMLARVPVRRDIRLRATKYDKDLPTI